MSTENKQILTNESITFGKYKGKNLSELLRDRNYCKWILKNEDIFKEKYPYIVNRIQEHNPSKFFFQETENNEDEPNFLNDYKYFNLVPVNELEYELSEMDKSCYEYYFQCISQIKEKIYERLEDEEENPYNIKAPTKWLKKFENKYAIPRSNFKEFLHAHELLNIPYIIERVKKEGGIIYLGAQSFKIAKKRSEEQEQWWKEVLRKKYNENISFQYRFNCNDSIENKDENKAENKAELETCIFDMLNIETKTIFECKLGLKDFDEAQHQKYKLVLKNQNYRIIYLIAKDCVIQIEKKKIYTTVPGKYKKYIRKIPTLKSPTYLDNLIIDFEIVKINDISTLFGKNNSE